MFDTTEAGAVWTGTYQEYVADAAAATPHPNCGEPFNTNDGSRYVGHKWQHYGTETWDDALLLARNGSPADTARMAAGMAAVAPHMTAIPVRSIRYDVAGERPDMSRYVSGDPAHMIDRRPSSRRARPVARFIVHCGATFNVSAEQKINRGASILGLIDTLETAGTRIEIEACFHVTTHGGKTYTARIELKAADEPTSIDVLAFALVNPAFQRRLDFAMRTRCPFNISGMGMSRDLDQSKIDDAAIYFPCITESSTWYNANTAAATIRSTYEAALNRNQYTSAA